MVAESSIKTQTIPLDIYKVVSFCWISSLLKLVLFFERLSAGCFCCNISFGFYQDEEF